MARMGGPVPDMQNEFKVYRNPEDALANTLGEAQLSHTRGSRISVGNETRALKLNGPGAERMDRYNHPRSANHKRTQAKLRTKRRRKRRRAASPTVTSLGIAVRTSN